MLRGDSSVKKGSTNRTADMTVVNAQSVENASGKNYIDKRFNKMLFNMHGIPMQPNVLQNESQKDKKLAPMAPPKSGHHQKPRISSKQRSITHNV
jgi:hypothetical protein